MIRHRLLIAMLGLLLTPWGTVQAYENEVFALKNRWEHITTQVPERERADDFSALAEDAKALAEEHPQAAQVLVWKGIILASEARAKGGIGALGLAKEARAALERAIDIDPQGNNGSAYVTLGALYDRAPGWPLGFGDSETAEKMFARALEIRPEGIDVNYYYATFLEDEGRLDEAREHARRAVEGQVREDRQASDEALREQARSLLAELE
ncbi:tetratricopeptide repeat protein [Litchfieldella rifensis]|uniref:Tetratricopeptide repeat protein n=1 Tax=Litchfieldella rifensis TaxID=762643 RepID=A0ABV7LJD9_9GAMM